MAGLSKNSRSNGRKKADREMSQNEIEVTINTLWPTSCYYFPVEPDKKTLFRLMYYSTTFFDITPRCIHLTKVYRFSPVKA